jgi:hypothetical protein
LVRQVVGVVDMDVQHRLAVCRIVVVREVDSQALSACKGVRLVVVGRFETEPLIVSDCAVDVYHAKAGFEANDAHVDEPKTRRADGHRVPGKIALTAA